MAKTKISEFSATPGNNTDIDGINIAEGCAPSGINDAIRELMAQLKDWQAGTSNDPYVVGSSGSLTLSYGTANGVPYLNGSKVVTSGSALTFDGTNFATTGSVTSAGSSNSGNLAFTGTGNRITGDFSNATTTSRVSFQSSTTNGATVVQLIPNGTSTSAQVAAYGGSDILNTSVGQLTNNGTEVRVASGIFGTGTYLPMTFYTGGSERVRVDTSGNVGIGTSSPSSFSPSTTYANTTAITKTDQALSFGSYYQAGVDAYAFIKASEVGSPTTATSLRFFGGNTERMVITSSGNVGIGTSSPATKLNVIGDIQLSRSATASDAALNFGSNANNYIYSGNSSNIMAFATGGTERMRIDSSGILLYGMTTRLNAGNEGALVQIKGTAVTPLAMENGDNLFIQAFWAKGTTSLCGSIQKGSGLTTSYVTSSDYRAKEDVQPLTGALNRVAALKPVTYKWKIDGSSGEGFIAHELQEVCPAAVAGEKDAVDAEGKPQYQGIDTSFLTATITAALQELHQIVKDQAAEIAELKAKLP